ncbi:DUF1254 domain-containing protein [Listeria booriae]|uniref:DUF1254 domain-containing protein n=2 Tax=Listeria booriae TaxID=1552123 RepID=UPI001626B399|nr:DUF1254 domain-containing protein [Listeria booriae]
MMEQSKFDTLQGIQTIGELPTRNSIATLFTEMDFYQATQLYLWGLPLVTFAEWQRIHEEEFGATSGDLVTYVGYEDLAGIITANATTPYTMGFIDLAKTGPMVIEIPKGHIAGGFSDFWQREVAAVGEMGPDKGQGGKYILLPPGMDDSEVYAAQGYHQIHSKMMNAFFGLRTLDPDPNVCKALVEEVKIYPYAKKDTIPPTRILSPAGKKYFAGPPKGILYWERLQSMIAREMVEDRDRIFAQWLDNLGVRKNVFDPTPRQVAILTAAVEKGELMAQSNSFAKRIAGARHWEDKHWDYVMIIPASSQRGENFDYFFERTSYFYEAVTYSKAMISKTPNVGQAYLGTYTDSDENWLDGSKNYTLRIPANPPAVNFWSITVYDSATRCLIQNEQKNADISSRKAIEVNADGSVDIYFGPEAPIGHESNWVQTNKDAHWFTYLRLYGPTEQYFDKSWKMGDIEMMRTAVTM